MTENERNLLHRYLDGAITEEELESLEELLRSSSEARATLRSLATIDAKWQQLAAEETFDPAYTAMVTRRVSEGPQAADRAEEHPLLTRRVTSNAAEPADSRRAVPRWLTVTALATALVVGGFGWFRASDDSPTQLERGIARVIRIEGDGTSGGDGNVVDGSELFAGEELAMQRGLIELAFRETGVHVVATAPLSMKLDSNQQLSLYEGQVKLVVPPQGVGFVVDTAQKKFVDLGTSFVVTADSGGSEVLVLDGQISVDDHEGTSPDLMHEGEFAQFDRSGKLKKRSASRESLALPELTFSGSLPSKGSLTGRVFGYDESDELQKLRPAIDVIGAAMLPLIESKFKDTACLEVLKRSDRVGYEGIAGAYHSFADRSGIDPYYRDGGWMAWYHGKVRPPQPGRYRFWGYADNHLLVAIEGKPVFEGSRRESPFRSLEIPRTNNPALPCLIARAGFASSDWVELSGDPVQLDILFGEVGGNITSGLLLVEREGESYEETFWGQPKWPLFLTETPSAEETAEFTRLLNHLEQRTMGSFSVSEDAVWEVAE